MLAQAVCFHFYCLLHLLTGLLDADRLILATESIQAGRDGQKSLCFICDKMVPKDSSKRRMHIGKHILKALRKVSETPVPVNNVIFFILVSWCVLIWIIDRSSSVWYMQEINIKWNVHCNTN